MKEIFTPDMKLSDMIDINFSLLQVMSRTGIDLKYAGMRVSEACKICGIDVATFILISNVYSFPEYIPSQSNIAAGNISDIIRYLRGSHAYYTGSALGSLAALFDRLLAPCDEKQKQVVLKFFNDYETELLKHFAHEEDQVFPYIEALLAGQGSSEYSIDEFEEHHENIEEKLEDMKNIVMKYLPDACSSDAKMAVLLSIYHLHDDLRRHTYVENNILVPIVGNLERHGK